MRITPTPRLLDVLATLEGEGLHDWLAAYGQPDWETTKGRLYFDVTPRIAQLSGPGIRVNVAFRLSCPGGDERIRADEAARLLLDALGELPDGDRLFAADLRLEVQMPR